MYELIPLVEGSMTVEAKTDISQLCGAISDSTSLLLEWGHYREAARILQLTGRACRKLGERLGGEEHQQYILQVRTSILAIVGRYKLLLLVIVATSEGTQWFADML